MYGCIRFLLQSQIYSLPSKEQGEVIMPNTFVSVKSIFQYVSKIYSRKCNKKNRWSNVSDALSQKVHLSCSLEPILNNFLFVYRIEFKILY